MMKEFDLNDFGKQMPYHVPEGFFARFPEQVMRKVAVERRRRRMWRLSAGMTAVAALVAGIVFWTGTPEVIPSVPSGDYADRWQSSWMPTWTTSPMKSWPSNTTTMPPMSH